MRIRARLEAAGPVLGRRAFCGVLTDEHSPHVPDRPVFVSDDGWIHPREDLLGIWNLTVAPEDAYEARRAEEWRGMVLEGDPG